MPVIRGLQSGHSAKIGVYSFGTKEPKKPKAQFEFDVSKLRDPAGQKQFSGKDGKSLDVQDWMRLDMRVEALQHICLLLADDLVAMKKKETSTGFIQETASNWLSLSFKDHHGKWAAPAIAEIVAAELSNAGHTVAIVHYGAAAEVK